MTVKLWRTEVALASWLVLAAQAGLAQDILLEKGPRGGAPESAGERPRAPRAEDLPPDAKTHVIVRGDTLWELARTYLGDPYLWPQIWEVNRYIVNPRLIYPGDLLVIPQPLLITEPGLPEEPLDVAELPAPQPVAKRVDVYCAPYVIVDEETVREREKRARRRVAAEPGRLEPTLADAEARLEADAERREAPEARRRRGRREPSLDVAIEDAPAVLAAEQAYKVAVGTGEVLYINRGELHGVRAGDEFLVVRPERSVRHPSSDERIGIAMQMVGTLQVLCTQERTATALLTGACEDVAVGSLIRPLEPIPIPLASEFSPSPQFCSPTTDRPTGYVIYARNGKITLGEEDLLNVDLGGAAGLVPGDFLVVYRPNELGPSFPLRVLGDAVVLLVESESATAKVLYSYHDMRVGDQVRLR